MNEFYCIGGETIGALIDNYSKEELQNIVNNSFSIKDVVRKLGYSAESGKNSDTVKNRIKKYGIDCSHFNYNGRTKRNEENVFIKNSTASQQVLRRWYKRGNYTSYICSICGQEPYWNGKELTLILDHINGENHDDRLENLRWVCPNCNQQLDTTGFKKFQAQKVKCKKTHKKECKKECKKKRKKRNRRKTYKITKERKKYFCKRCGKEIGKTKNELCNSCYQTYKAENSKMKKHNVTRNRLKFEIRYFPFTTIAKFYGVSDKCIEKWCKKYNLPYHSKEIRKIPDEDWENI